MTQYLYILKERQFITTCQEVYKIGQTTQDQQGSSLAKGKGMLIIQSICFNSLDVHKRLIVAFSNNFIPRKDIGSEYFEGNCVKMLQLFIQYLQLEELTENKLFNQSLDLKRLVEEYISSNYIVISKEEYFALTRKEKGLFMTDVTEIFQNFKGENDVCLNRKEFKDILKTTFDIIRTTRSADTLLGYERFKKIDGDIAEFLEYFSEENKEEHGVFKIFTNELYIKYLNWYRENRGSSLTKCKPKKRLHFVNECKNLGYKQRRIRIGEERRLAIIFPEVSPENSPPIN